MRHRCHLASEIVDEIFIDSSGLFLYKNKFSMLSGIWISKITDSDIEYFLLYEDLNMNFES